MERPARRPPLWRVMVSHRSGIARSSRRRPPPQPGRQLQHPRRARRQHRPARADDEAGAAAGADGVRGDGVRHELRTPLAVTPIGRRQPRRRRRRRRHEIRRYGELMRAETSPRWSSNPRVRGMPSGQRGLALRPVPIRDRQRLRVGAADRGPGIRSRSTSPPAIPATLGDEPALRRVFQNLVDNAIKYGGSGGWMRVSARPRRDVPDAPFRPPHQHPAEQPSRCYRAVAAQMQHASASASFGA